MWQITAWSDAQITASLHCISRSVMLLFAPGRCPRGSKSSSRVTASINIQDLNFIAIERLRFVMYSPRATGIQFFQQVSYIPRSLIPSSNNSDLCSKSALRGSAKHAHEPPCLSSCASHASRDHKHQQPPRI